MGCSQEQQNPSFSVSSSSTGETKSMTASARSDLWSSSAAKKKKNKNPVLLEGFVESSVEEDDQEQVGGALKGVSRSVSLTDEDLDELKGCVDLGFGFNYEEIPELCSTLPALELCYSITQKFLDDQQQQKPSASSSSSVTDHEGSSSESNSANPIANWKISSPGDHPEEVKARLKYWAQAVACTVKLCS